MLVLVAHGAREHVLVEQALQRTLDGDAVHVDERAAGLEQRKRLSKQLALARGREVVDGKAGDHRVVAASRQPGLPAHAGEIAAHDLPAPWERREVGASALEHRLREVHEHSVGMGVLAAEPQHELADGTGAGTEVEEALDGALAAGQHLREDLLLHIEQRDQHAPALGEARHGVLLLPGNWCPAFRRGGAHDHSRMSTKRPSMAAAAAICGDTRCVRPPRPWRPSKLRLEVEAQRSPGARMSGFMPRHMEQPATRQSKPASRNTWSSPSASACALTCCEPGTTIALTEAATFLPATTFAAARRSPMRELVHEPMNTRSTAICSIGVPGSSAM